MAEVLVVTWDGGGNVSPALGIAAALVGRGHRVHVLGHEQQRDAVAGCGLGFSGFRGAPPWSSARSAPGVRGALELVRMMSSPVYGREVAAAVRSRRPDVVLVDGLLPSAVAAAVHSDVPTAVLGHTFWQYMRRWARGPVGLAATVRGSPPARAWSGAELVLVAADPQLDPAGPGTLPGHVVHTGIVGARPARPVPTSPPTVLVSLSTVDFDGQSRALQAIVDGLAALDARVVVTTGPAVDPGTLQPRANTELLRYRSHDELMPSVSAVVGHGGHGTTMRALAHGLPLLVLPQHPLLDQPLIGRAVQRAGAGLLRKRTTPPTDIAAAVHAVLTEPRFRVAAAEIGRRLVAHDGTLAAVEQLETLLPREARDPR